MASRGEIAEMAAGFERITGRSLPEGTADLTGHWERGIDTLVALYFTAPEAAAAAFASDILGMPPKADSEAFFNRMNRTDAPAVPKDALVGRSDRTYHDWVAGIALGPMVNGRRGVWVEVITL